MCVVIWSCSDDDAMAFLVRTFVRFWVNYYLLNIIEWFFWWVVSGWLSVYVDVVECEFKDVCKGVYVIKVYCVAGGVSVIFKIEDVKGKV